MEFQRLSEHVVRVGRKKYGFGRIARPDARDQNFLMRSFLAAPPTRDSHTWYCRYVLDQGATPRCVGYAGKNFMNTAPITSQRPPSANELYSGAQAFDGEPLPHDGSDGHGLMKYMLSRDLVRGGYVWAQDANDVREWVLSRGSVLVGSNWYDSMFEPDGHGILSVSGQVAGGHEYLLMGYSAKREAFRLLNSWGKSWGQNGRAWLKLSDLQRLLSEAGDAVSPLEVARG